MKIVFTPDWFLSSDVVIETFSFFTLILFFILSYRYYKISRNRKTLYLGVGFLLIAVAELATIFTKLVLFYDTTFTQQIGQAIITYNIAKSVDVFYEVGFFFHKLLTLAGLYIIYRLPLKRASRSDIPLVIYFMAISALSSTRFNFIFHLTALILLIMIINSYYKVYIKNRSKNTRLLLIAFLMLALSQMIFMLSKMEIMYVLAQGIQSVSYIILLFLIIRILKHGDPKFKGN